MPDVKRACRQRKSRAGRRFWRGGIRIAAARKNAVKGKGGGFLSDNQTTLFSDNPEYEAFVEKFKRKKTTDDCYTPENVYNAVADWVAQEYGLDRASFVRPFWPDGDYQSYPYPPDCVVVDNPPFSILTKIIRFYVGQNVRFFLFAPTLTLFSSKAEGATYIPVGGSVTYENGATVNTSFVTNLDQCHVRTAPDLYRIVNAENNKNLKALHKELPRYSYPDCVLTAAMVARWSKYGVDFRLDISDCAAVSALDEQRQHGKTIFGTGLLLSERAAAERAAAERAAAMKWRLSEREWAIVRSLGGEKGAAECT